MRYQRGYRVSLFGSFLKKILDGSLSGTVCALSCLEDRNELDQLVFNRV